MLVKSAGDLCRSLWKDEYQGKAARSVPTKRCHVLRLVLASDRRPMGDHSNSLQSTSNSGGSFTVVFVFDNVEWDSSRTTGCS